MNSLDTIPRIRLAETPTPLTDVPRLASQIGLSSLSIKRDDLTGFAGGGTKVRKLEYDLADILARECDTVIAAGGVQSNLVRIMAAAASRCGLSMKAVLGGPAWTSLDGNLLLDTLFGAEIRFLKDDDENDHLTAAMDRWEAELTAAGHRPATLPIGGSTAIGSLGVIDVVKEIIDQLPTPQRLQIVLPVGSCGTFAGLLLGCRLLRPETRIIGISVSRSASAIIRRTMELLNESAQLIEPTMRFSADELECYDSYHGTYGVPMPAAQEAILLTARTDGIILDPVYTGKAMSGMIDLAKRRILDPSLPTIFLHTGGVPVLYAYESEFRSIANNIPTIE